MSLSIVTPAFMVNTDFGWFSHFLHLTDRPDAELLEWQNAEVSRG